MTAVCWPVLIAGPPGIAADACPCAPSPALIAVSSDCRTLFGSLEACAIRRDVIASAIGRGTPESTSSWRTSAIFSIIRSRLGFAGSKSGSFRNRLVWFRMSCI